jgi:hypothetical protein
MSRKKLSFDLPLESRESNESNDAEAPEEDAPLSNGIKTSGIPAWQQSQSSFAPFGLSTYQSTPLGLRTEIIDKTLSFLRNPNVAGTSLAKQREFLLAKGVTETELQYCLDKVNSSLIYLPPRPNYTNLQPNIPQGDPFVVQPKLITIPSPKTSLQQHLIRILWALGISGGVVAAIGWVLRSARKKLLLLFSEYVAARGEALQSYILKLLAITKMYRPTDTVTDSEYITDEIFGDKLKTSQTALLSTVSTPFIELPGLEEESIPGAFDKLEASLDSHVSTLDEIAKYKQQIEQELEDPTLVGIKKMADETSTLLTNETYFNSSTLYSRSSYVYSNASKEEIVEPWIKTLQEIKEDIRSLKGGMLSRRNFASGINFTTPKIVPKAAYQFKPRTMSAPDAPTLTIEELPDESAYVEVKSTNPEHENVTSQKDAETLEQST